MNYIAFLLVFLCFGAHSTVSEEKSSSKDFLKAQLYLSGGYASIGLPSATYGDPGFTVSLGYFLLPKLSINGHYFLTASPSGSSNMNGFGFQGKYYFYNTETSFQLKQRAGRVRTFDRYFAYGSFQFLDRDIRTSRLNVSYTGFGASLGGGYKLNYQSAVGVDVLRGILKSPAGSQSNTDASFTNVSAFYSYFF